MPRPQPDHICPCGCGARISYRRLACRDGWLSLPSELKKPLTENRQGTPAHWVAVVNAVDWFAQRRGGTSTPDGGRPC